MPRFLLLCTILWLLFNSVVLAVPPLPCSVYGTVKINGQNINEGTIISAWIDGVKYAEKPSWMYAGQSWYGILSIPGDDDETAGVREGGRPGDTVTFKIGEMVADQTIVWQADGDVPLDLTVSMATATPTATGTPTNTPTRPPDLVYLPAIIKNGGRPSSTATPTATSTPTATPTMTLIATATPTRTATSSAPQTLSFTPSQDTYIRVSAMGDNFGWEGIMPIKTDQESKRPMLQFDLSAIPPHATVLSASMTLQTNWYTAPVPPWPMTVQCYALLRPWAEDEATWLEAIAGQPWQVPGADGVEVDRAALPASSAIVSAPNSSYTFELSALAQQWVSEPMMNNGILLKGDGNISEYRFFSSNYLIPDQIPVLKVTFRR